MSGGKFAGLKSRSPRPASPPPADGPMPGPVVAENGAGEGGSPPPEAPQGPQEPKGSPEAAAGAASAPAPSTAPPAGRGGRSSPARQGKVMVAGYFSPEVNRRLRVMAAERGTTVQALLGEALDELMRVHGKHPFGER